MTQSSTWLTVLRLTAIMIQLTGKWMMAASGTPECQASLRLVKAFQVKFSAIVRLTRRLSQSKMVS